MTGCTAIAETRTGSTEPEIGEEYGEFPCVALVAFALSPGDF